MISGKKTTERLALQLPTFIRRIHPIGKNALQYIMKHAYTREVPRGKLLVKSGSECSCYYFIQEGLFRSFIVENKKEITGWICGEGNIVTTVNNLRHEATALENIQALEDGRVICLPYEAVQFLYTKYTSINVLARKLLEQYYVDAEIRSMISRVSNAEKRYDWFLKVYPQLSNRVPLKYIASFLGITLETLSRIRAKKKTMLSSNEDIL